VPWDPDRYLRFRQQRFQPFEDLLALITVRPGLRVVDLGCGTGELTRRLADALPESEVVGIDSSAEMLARAGAVTRPGLRFEPGLIEDIGGTWDLIFSHAAIQWVDDHSRLVPRLMALLAPGGQVAIQLPANHEHPSQRLARDTARSEPFGIALDGWIRDPQALAVEAYAELLYAGGGSEITALAKVYPHVLEDAGAIADWMRGTALVPYLERLPDELHDRFLEEYGKRLAERFPGRPVFFGFKRILFAASV